MFNRLEMYGCRLYLVNVKVIKSPLIYGKIIIKIYGRNPCNTAIAPRSYSVFEVQ